MAWQAVGNVGGNVAGGNGADTNGQNAQPPGLDYTLTGVMRFLQVEWHRHERERNAWDIERAEMKSRIGKLEGDCRTNKRLQESLGNLVKMLETALRKEREKVRQLQSLSQNGAAESTASKDKSADAADDRAFEPGTEIYTGPMATFALEAELKKLKEIRQDPERERSRNFLAKCMQEVIYHVVPTTFAHQQHAEEEEYLRNQQFLDHNVQYDPVMMEVYDRQHRVQPQGKNMTNAGNHADRPQQPQQRVPVMNPESYSRQISRPAPLDPNNNKPLTHDFRVEQPEVTQTEVPADGDLDEQLEVITHSYDGYGRQIPTRVEQTTGKVIQRMEDNENNDWNFDDDRPTEPPKYTTPARGDVDAFPTAEEEYLKSGNRAQYRRFSSDRRTQSEGQAIRDGLHSGTMNASLEPKNFEVMFSLQGHLDVVRAVVFSGAGTQAEPEICTAGDDGVIKRWAIPSKPAHNHEFSSSSSNNVDVSSIFTHRGHEGSVLCLAASPISHVFLSGGRSIGDGWLFSGGEDGNVCIWERNRVNPKAVMTGHTDAVWTVAVLPGSTGSVLGERCTEIGGPDRLLVASGSADGSIIIWAVSAPPSQAVAPMNGSRRVNGASRRANSISSGSAFSSGASTSSIPCLFTQVHRIQRADMPSPTCISPLSANGEMFVVSFNDSSVLIFTTRTGEEVVGMASQETYDGTPATGVNIVVASIAAPLEKSTGETPTARRLSQGEDDIQDAASSGSGVDGVVISGHEDQYIRFFDANSGQCTYTMLAHPAAISALSLSPDGRELVSGGHDSSLRFWNLETRTCTQEIACHRPMRGEGICATIWSQDGRWVVSAGGDGSVKVFGR